MQDRRLIDILLLIISSVVLYVFVLPHDLLSSNPLEFPTPKNLNDYLSWTQSSPLGSYFNFYTTLVTRAALMVSGNHLGALAAVLIFGSFVLFYFIFRQFLNRNWSLSLSFLSLFCFSAAPFRSFLFASALGREFNFTDELAVLSMPFPCISLFSFLFALYFTVRTFKFDAQERLAGSALWNVQIFIYPLNALFGLPLWTWVLWRRYQREHLRGETTFLKFWSLHIALTLLCVVPAVIAFVASAKGVEFTAASAPSVQFADELYAALYFVLPIGLILGLAALGKIDRFEIFEKFGIFYVLSLCELVFMLFDLCFLSGTNYRLLFSRFFIFTHFLYLIPFLFYLQRAKVFLTPYRQSSSFFGLKKIIANAAEILPKVVLPAVLILFIYFLNSNRLQVEAYKAHVRANTAQEMVECDWAKAQLAKDTKIAAASALPLMQVCLSNTGRSLWNNLFLTNPPAEASLIDVATYFKLDGRTVENFKAFMQPNVFAFDSAELNHEYLMHQFIGLGWFLIYQQQGLSHQVDRVAYEHKLDNVWAANRDDQFNNVYFFSTHELSADWKLVRSTPLGNWYLNRRSL